MDAAQFIQISFAIATTASLLFCVNPFLRSRYLSYGLRAVNPVTDVTPQARPKQDSKLTRTPVYKLFDRLITYPLPRTYFIHFYLFSVISSLFWAYQIHTRGSVLQFIAEFGSPRTKEASMSVEQVVLTWSLMTAQGLRRLIETIALERTSASTMQLSHYVVGFLHYLGVGIAVWIEGSETILSDGLILKRLALSALSLKTMFNVPIFVLASFVQHKCHVYLASLPKYTLPMGPPFETIISPHYTAECLIYGALALLAAPQGSLVNRTLFAVLVWVVCNLGSTVYANKAWYSQKFGREKVADRWMMIPLVW